MIKRFFVCMHFLAIFFYFTLFHAAAQSPSGPPNGAGPLPMGPTQPLTQKQIKTVVEKVAAIFVENYIFPDTAQKMADRLRKAYRDGTFKSITDPIALAEAINQTLQHAHPDGHVRINFDPRFAQALMTGPDGSPPVDRLTNPEEMKKDNYLFRKSEVLTGNIGYLRIDGFTPLPEAKEVLLKALGSLEHTNALIIDLRYNGGGSGEAVLQLASVLFPIPTRLNDAIFRAGDRMDTVIGRTDPNSAGGLLLKMPVYILTSHRTFSAAEDLAYGLQSAGRAIVVGETTGGGAHPLRPFPVGEGFVAGVPTGRSLNYYTHTDWEGTGVVPNAPVGADQALDKAIELAKATH